MNCCNPSCLRREYTPKFGRRRPIAGSRPDYQHDQGQDVREHLQEKRRNPDTKRLQLKLERDRATI
jgi:hypothetical protein